MARVQIIAAKPLRYGGKAFAAGAAIAASEADARVLVAAKLATYETRAPKRALQAEAPAEEAPAIETPVEAGTAGTTETTETDDQAGTKRRRSQRKG